MIKWRFIHVLTVIFYLSWKHPALANHQEKLLTLPEAESLALHTSPELRRFHAAHSAWHNQAIADGQLSDP